MVEKKATEIVSSIILDIGILFLLSPVLLYWWIHADYERYLWIINGPGLLSNFGSGPYQLVLYGVLALVGIMFIVVARILRRRALYYRE